MADAPQLPNINRDALMYNIRIKGTDLEVTINKAIKYINDWLRRPEYYHEVVPWLNFLLDVLVIRKDDLNFYKKRAFKVPNTTYAVSSIIIEYNDLIKLAVNIRDRLKRYVEQQQIARQLQIKAEQERAERERIERERLARHRRELDIMVNVLNRARNERQQELYNLNLLRVVHNQLEEIAETEELIQDARITIRAFIGSDTINNATYYITDESHLADDHQLFEDLRERESLRAVVSYQDLAPIFNINFTPRVLTHYNGNVHAHNISVTNPRQIETIKNTLRELTESNDEFYDEDVWYRIEFPRIVTRNPVYAMLFARRGSTTVEEDHSRQIRERIAAYNQQQVDNYQLLGDVVFPHYMFKNTPKIHHENCLINELITAYSFLTSNRISKDTIIKQFLHGHEGKPPFGTTIGGLKKFCRRWKISYTIFDILDDIIAEETLSDESTRRKTLAFIVHQNHISRYVGDLGRGKGTIDLSSNEESKENHTLSGYRDTRKLGKNKFKKEFTTPGLGGWDKQGHETSQGRANFSFLWEKDHKSKALFYEDLKIEGRREVWDMASAYYTCVMNMNPNQAIPKFQVTDEPKPFNLDDGLNPLYRYYLRDISEKVNANKGLNAFGGQITNYMEGYRLIYEIVQGRLDITDVSHVRIPSDYDRAKRLQHILKGVDPSDFKFINGLFGQSHSGSKTVTLDVSLQDLQLLLFKCPELEYTKNANGTFKVTKQFNKGKYKYLNNFDYYNHIIESCNYNLTKKVDEMIAANIKRFPDIKVVKIWVDCVGFNYTADNGLFTGPLVSDNIRFKKEYSNFCGNDVKFKYVDPQTLIDKSREELRSFMDHNNTIRVTGMSGSGKTYHATRNIPHDIRVTFKNANAIRIKGETIHSTFLLMCMKEFYKHASRTFKNKTILVDELSEITSYMWSIFFTCHKLYNTKFILVGDFNQIPPYGENPNYEDYFWSSLQKDAIHPPGNHSRCDPDVIELALGLLNDVNYPIPEHLFHNKFHHTINKHYPFTINCKDVGNKMVTEARGFTFDPPSIGLTVVATKKNKSMGYLTGQTFIVTDFAAYVTLKCIDDPENINIITIPAKNYLNHFTPGYFRTIHSSQGATVDEPMCIYEIDKIRTKPNGNRILYTAITRVRHMNQLHLYHKYPEGFDVPVTINKNIIPRSYLRLMPDDVKPVEPNKKYTVQDLLQGLKDCENKTVYVQEKSVGIEL